MSRWLFLTALLAAWPAERLLAQQVRTIDPALTIRVARDERGIDDPAAPGAVVSAVCLSPDGHTIAVVGDDHIVRTFALADGRRLHELAGHQRWVRGAAFALDGRSLITADEDRKIIFWDTLNQRNKQELNAGIQVYGLAMSPLGDQFAVAGFGGRLRLIGTDGQLGAELTAPGPDTRAVAFSADGQRLAAAARNGKLSVWRLPQAAPVIDGMTADRRAIYAVAFSPDGRWLATGGDGEFIHVWDAQTGKKRLSIRRPGKTRSLIFCGADVLAAGGTDNRVRIWDLARVEKKPAANDLHIEDIQLVGHQGSVTSLVFIADTQTIISGSYDTTVRVWNLNTASPRTTDAGSDNLR